MRLIERCSKIEKAILVIAIALVTSIFNLAAQTNPNHVKVNGYYKSDGTYVQPHYRTAPNSTNKDNFSTKGNVNPYTGEPGYVLPDNGSNPYSNSYNLIPEPYSATPKPESSSIDNSARPTDLGRVLNKQPNLTTTNTVTMTEQRDPMSKIVSLVPSNSNVRVLSKYLDEDFTLVRYKNMTGFIPSGNLYGAAKNNSSNEAKSFANTQNYHKKTAYNIVFYTTENVNMREGRSIDSDIVVVVPFNTEVRVMSKNLDDDWLLVFFKGKVGFAYASFLKKEIHFLR